MVAMRAAMAENEEAARVTLGEEEVIFVNVKVGNEVIGETDRIKHLGEYQVEVRLKGAATPVQKNVRVLALES